MQLDHHFFRLMRIPVLQVWSAVSPDLCDTEELTNEAALEECLNYERLCIYDTYAGVVFQGLCNEHGYNKVRDFLLQHFTLV